MQYVSASPPGDPGCGFCNALDAGDDRGALILCRRAQAYLMLNAFPYASGHLMAVTARHGGGIPEASAGELADVMALVQLGMRTLGRVYQPQGYNVGVNDGRVAG